MKIWLKKPPFSLSWKMIFLLLGISVLFAKSEEPSKQHRAKQGVMDLLEWDQNSILPLSGEWYFFPDRLMEPNEFLQIRKRGEASKFAESSVSFKSLKGNRYNSKHQQATYALHLKHFPDRGSFSVGLSQFYSYSRMYVFNGKGQMDSNSPMQVGKFPTIGQESEVRIGSMNALRIPENNSKEDIFILVQIGNDRHGWSGMWMAPLLGSTDNMTRMTVIFDRVNNIFRGLLLFTILYHSMFFLHHRRDKGSIYLAVFCTCFLLHNVFLESYVRHFTPFGNLEHEIATRGIYVMLILNNLAFHGFIRTYFPNQFSARLMRWSAWMIAGLTIHFIFAPFTLVSGHWTLTAFFSAVLVTVSAQAIGRAYLQREQGAAFAMGGFVFLVTMLFLDAAQTFGIGFWLIPESFRAFFSIFGVAGFIVFQSQVIAQRYALALQTSFHLSNHLKSEVDRQTLELRQQRDVLATQQEQLKGIHRDMLQRFLPTMLVTDIMEGRAHVHEESMSREITVMFTDLVSFTSATEKLGPQAITIILNEYLKTMTDLVFEHQGTVDKFMGDGILVLFGTPQVMSPEEQVSRSIACAQDMLIALDKLNRNWQKLFNHNFSMRIGIHRGTAVVGYFGGSHRSDYTAIGQTVNIAARVEPMAAPGQIMVTASVVPFMDPGSYVAEGSFHLKGLSHPIELYRMRQSKAA